MARTLPTEPIEWAELAAGADVVEPATGIREAGYQFEDILPHTEHNAVLRGMYRWLQYLGGAGGAYSFSSVLAAEASGLLEAGDSFTVQDDKQAFESIFDVTAAGTPDVVDCHGHNGYLAIMLDTGVVFVLGDDLSVVSAFTAAAAPQSICCGPAGVAAIDGTSVELFSYAGTSLWSYNHSAVITDIAMDHTHLYLCGASGTNADGTGTHRAINLTTGLEVWTQAWGATLNTVHATGVSVLVGGNMGGGTYAGEINRLTGVSIRNLTLPSAPVGKRTLVTDGLNFYAMCSGGLFRFSVSTGDYALSSSVAALGLLCVDDQFVYVRENSATSNVKVYPKTGVEAGRMVELRIQAGGTAVRALYSNGRRLLVGYDYLAGEVATLFATTGKNKRFQRVADGNFKPMGMSISPETTSF